MNGQPHQDAVDCTTPCPDGDDGQVEYKPDVNICNPEHPLDNDEIPEGDLPPTREEVLPYEPSEFTIPHQQNKKEDRVQSEQTETPCNGIDTNMESAVEWSDSQLYTKVKFKDDYNMVVYKPSAALYSVRAVPHSKDCAVPAKTCLRVSENRWQEKEMEQALEKDRVEVDTLLRELNRQEVLKMLCWAPHYARKRATLRQINQKLHMEDRSPKH